MSFHTASLADIEACPRDVRFTLRRRTIDRRQFHARHATLLHSTVPAGPMNLRLRCTFSDSAIANMAPIATYVISRNRSALVFAAVFFPFVH